MLNNTRHHTASLRWRSFLLRNVVAYAAADFELGERNVIKNEKVALDRLRIPPDQMSPDKIPLGTNATGNITTRKNAVHE